jgi:hypothetical protein
MVVTGLALSGLAVFAGSAGAAPDDIVIDVTGVVFGAPGSVTVVQEVTVDPALVGATCAGLAITANNTSVHPNTDLIVTTGSSQVEFDDVEAVSDEITEASDEVVLGPTITVAVRLGADGVASGGATLTFDCQSVPTTTTTAPTTTTTAPPTTVPPTTVPPTTVPPTTVAPTTVTVPPTAPPSTEPQAPPTTSASSLSPQTATQAQAQQLAVTGGRSTGPLLALGVGLVLFGVFLGRVARSR